MAGQNEGPNAFPNDELVRVNGGHFSSSATLLGERG
jgi:hypothetical protein